MNNKNNYRIKFLLPALCISIGNLNNPAVGNSMTGIKENFEFVKNDTSVTIYVDKDGMDFDGLELVAESFTKDLKLISKEAIDPQVITDRSFLKGNCIIAGSVGNNTIIDSLAVEGKIDLKNIQGKSEVYKIQIVDNPIPNVKRAVVVAGSDKRGTIYGIYHISELIGVSPWYYWADAVPEKKSEVNVSADSLSVTSKEPSVRYRGIFLNDEAPSLSGWVSSTFGTYNEDFYQHVFELILRLKGNYLWPAMWSNVFSEDGKSFPQANAYLANKYGIVMGTSHHEPLCRAGAEWQRIYSKYGTSNAWNFSKNEKAITKFWDDSLTRNENYENVYTIGMRGEADSALGGSIQDNIDLLKKVITTQKELLANHGLADNPKMIAIYKEVEDFWHGTDTVKGLKYWDGLDDTIVMLCDDNFGNLRTLPEKEQRDRKGGWGMYYHFDYHGGPTSYEWVNTMQLNKTWEQMTMAYKYGIDDIWIVNVGDLKPQELNISYFLDLAYDFDTWGTNGRNRTDDYLQQWVAQQFDTVPENVRKDMVKIFKDYTWLNTSCKPAVLKPDTYSIENYHEAEYVLGKAQQIIDSADRDEKEIPRQLRAAYFQLIYYPAVASANVAQMEIYAGLNQYCAKHHFAETNDFADLTEKCITKDKHLQFLYNYQMPGVINKWQKMMSSPHVGYVTWDSKGWSYPKTERITTDSKTNADEERFARIASGDFSAGIRPESVSESGTDADLQTKITPGVIKGKDTSDLPAHTYLYTDGYASIDSAVFTSKGSGTDNSHFEVINDYGKMGNSVKAFPPDGCYENDIEQAPWIEYSVYIPEAGQYKLTTFTSPSSNVDRDSVTIRFGLSVNGGKIFEKNTIDSDYMPGTYNNRWPADVTNNGRSTELTIVLHSGLNTIRYYAVDPAFVLQKIVISDRHLPKSHFGPPESYSAGEE